MAVITISRQFGSRGEMIAEKVARTMGYHLVNKPYILEELKRYQISEPQFEQINERSLGPMENLDRQRRRYLEAVQRIIRDLAQKQDLVVLGRGGPYLLRDLSPALHVKVIAPLKKRVEHVQSQYQLSSAAAARLVSEQDQHREAYILSIFGEDWLNPEHFSLIANTGQLQAEEAARAVIEAARKKFQQAEEVEGIEETAPPRETPAVKDALGEKPPFAHPSEEEFAKMLDFYQIKWLYEPRTFPLEWDSEGNITEAFAPDFYLPELDLYVELTTQKQKLVWKKNKKIRRLREIYPDTRVKIIYGRDYRGLLQKYGIEEEGRS